MHILGIRHHGPGSARKVAERLEALRPDIVLVEGPPEMDAVTHYVGLEMLQPPVAVLCYDEKSPQKAVFYPFAQYSPEWQAMLYAQRNNIPIRMMDWPVAVNWAWTEANTALTWQNAPSEDPIQRDPLGYFARIAGYEDSERWWDRHFERTVESGTAESHFEAVLLMMKTLRDSQEAAQIGENEYREAWMGQIIRKAMAEGYRNIAVVCGAWHAPALADAADAEKRHAKLLKQLPKPKKNLCATWIPWTNLRLGLQSGYGAGIASPGWYQHIWQEREDTGLHWLTRVAALLRRADMDISTAHVLEAARLSESLAALRSMSSPGLEELNEAVVSVMCMGDGIMLDLVRQELMVGHDLGVVPESLPQTPLQRDFEATAKRLRLPLSAEPRDKDLNLREPVALEQSIFLHRLGLLGIGWAEPLEIRSKGTFKERWRLCWQPEMMIALIEMGVWGNTIPEAAAAWLLDQSARQPSVTELARLIGKCLPAELYEALQALINRLENVSALSVELTELMDAIPPLAEARRYGNVRNTDQEALQQVAESMLTRVAIGLPGLAFGLDETNASLLFQRIRRVHDAQRLLEQAELSERWFRALGQLAEQAQMPPILSGAAARLLFDAQVHSREETAQLFGLALSVSREAAYAAGWLEGFLSGSGVVLLYDESLWAILFQWVQELPEEAFIRLLPILRRTFSRFSINERRQLGAQARRGIASHAADNDDDLFFDLELARQAMLGIAKMIS